ncbi:DUF294 nucleotidyltransferase-like domain-containing protein [Enterovibrio sp. ZSDZ42]|uniref:DUF294 nucleotidyltransferase-like domain-containing protein n=1 Tax=Enterovibrio gelatinilyticus TaxID=2899819 RepID=A0ABT5R6A0_9GAMM|nr:DUF294 nucleotidyltransferase-like domain-containing protein [Enterovibrio sp. ZSDZ42]MDD1795802.1 DUF294 nucleotidyltransferase-like domain-containing protein [Enterovibrio sp. ZSDZ42]
MPEPFDTSSPPFDRLDTKQAQTLLSALDVAYYRRGDTLIEKGDQNSALNIVIKGRVQEVNPDTKEVQAQYIKDDLFDARALLLGHSHHSYRAVEDTLCYVLPKAVFVTLYDENQAFADYFNTSFSQRKRLLEKAQQQQNLAEFILTQVDETNIQPIVTLNHDTSIHDATHILRKQRQDCALVAMKGGENDIGIITRTNLLHALVEDGHSQAHPIGDVATAPVISVEVGDFLFNVMILMTRDRVKRVRVTDNGETVGMLDMTQVLSLFSTHSHVLTLQINRAHSIEELALAANNQQQLVTSLTNNGIHTQFVMELISAVNEQIIEKAFRLTMPDAFYDKCCLFVMGSEGRGEQILKTDQDNGLILADDADWPDVQHYMARFSEVLSRLGYPPCPGNVMVSNPRWVKTQSEWQKEVLALCQISDERSLMDLAIIADSHAVAGNKSLLEPVADRLRSTLKGNMLALNTFVRPCLAFRVPLTLFGSLRTDKEGLDVKKGGIFPLVHGVRTLALEKGIRETNTFDRLNALVECHALEQETANNLTEALKLFVKTRLRQQLNDDAASGNQLDVTLLPRTERDLLRDCLSVVKKFKERLASHYQVRD